MANKDIKIGGGKRHGTSLWIWDGCCPSVSRDGYSKQIKNWIWNTKVGDKWTLEFDFKKRKCVVFYNGLLLGTFPKFPRKKDNGILPRNIYLAATSRVRGTSFATTLALY